MKLSAASPGIRTSVIASSGVPSQPERARHAKSPDRESLEHSDTTSQSRIAAVAFVVSSAIWCGDSASEIASANSSHAFA